LGLHPAGDLRVFSPLGNAQFFRVRDGCWGVVPRLASLRDDVDGDPLALELVPAAGVFPDDLDPVARSDAGEDVQIRGPYHHVDVLGEALVAVMDGRQA